MTPVIAFLMLARIESIPVWRFAMKSALVLGAGSRGRAYADYSLSHPDELRIVAVAEPDESRREAFRKRYGLEAGNCFCDWRDALAKGRIADCVFICTLDDMHREPALTAMELGYEILLEKPMANRKDDCIAIAEAAERSGVHMAVCHVLRYTPFFRTIRRAIADGMLGEVAVINLTENVAYWHMAHSFVRGNWSNSDETSPMILQKSCHDMDIMLYLLSSHCLSLSSYGSLRHFTKENAPSGASERCLDCHLAKTCPYDAAKLYLGENTDWPVDVISTDHSLEARSEALRTGRYGRCVYSCDNNVVDRQVVALSFEGGTVGCFTMTGFTTDHTREIKIMGTKAQLVGRMDSGLIEYSDFSSGKTRVLPLVDLKADTFGHGGGDELIVREFLKGEGELSRPSVSLESHLMCFAAEESRLSGGRPVEIAQCR